MEPLKADDEQPKETPHAHMADDAGHTFVAPEPPPMSPAQKAHVMAGLSYLGVLFIIPLLFVPKKNHALQFHLRQGIVLFVVESVCAAILPFLLVLPIVAAIYGCSQAVAGREWELPLLGKYAKRIRL